MARGQTVIADDQLSACVFVRDDGTVVAPPTGQHPSQVLRKWRSGPDARNLIVLRELSLPDVRHYSDAEIVEALLLLQFVLSRPLLRMTIAIALGDLSGRVKFAVNAEVERRAVGHAPGGRSSAPITH
jgi:hypothetical protein